MALRRYDQGKPDRPMQVNMTSMVDIVFLLIIFFVLVSQFISADNILVELPDPERSLAKAVELPERVVLNCQYVHRGPGGRSRARFLRGVSKCTVLSSVTAVFCGTDPSQSSTSAAMFMLPIPAFAMACIASRTMS